MKKLMFLVIISMFLLSGCATIIVGTKTKVDFTSTPAGATVIVDGNQIGVTPMFDHKIKNRSKEVVFKLEGYDLLTYKIPHKANLFYMTNLAFTSVGVVIISPLLTTLGLVGVITDLASGATKTITQTEFEAILKNTTTFPPAK